MKDFLVYLLTQIVDHPEDIVVDELPTNDYSISFTIRAKQEDIGKIIGKEGKIIQSIRNLVKVLAVKQNKQIRIDIGE